MIASVSAGPQVDWHRADVAPHGDLPVTDPTAPPTAPPTVPPTALLSAPLSAERSADLAAALLRVTQGGLLVAHALLKLVVFTPAGTAGYFASLGLPGAMAHLVIATELLGGLALIAGFRVRAVALALVPLMAGAAWFGHGSAGFFFMNEGGGWEFPAFWTIVLVAQALLGAGAFAIDHR